jgi:hypothetical protein
VDLAANVLPTRPATLMQSVLQEDRSVHVRERNVASIRVETSAEAVKETPCVTSSRLPAVRVIQMETQDPKPAHRAKHGTCTPASAFSLQPLPEGKDWGKIVAVKPVRLALLGLSGAYSWSLYSGDDVKAQSRRRRKRHVSRRPLRNLA